MSPETASAWELIEADASRRDAPRLAPRVAEVMAWASMVDPGPHPSNVQHDRAVDAVGEAADGDVELVHRAWLAALRALRDGNVTRSCVALLRAAAEELLETAPPLGATQG
jgi:hypothetical protein